MTTLHTLGFPRIGAQRELKQALETYWRDPSQVDALHACGRSLRQRHLLLQRAAGIDQVPVGDFSYYDHVLDAMCLFGALPRRFAFDPAAVGLPEYFALARGNTEQPALEMTKWFDTNYHYLVPEYDAETRFSLHAERLFEHIEEAQALGIKAKPVLLGPLTLLWLGKSSTADRLDLLSHLLPCYQRLLQQLATRGVSWVQFDEPILALELPPAWRAAFKLAYTALADSGCKMLLTTYFGSVEHHAELITHLPINGLHLDLIRAPQQLARFAQDLPSTCVLSLGVIDGRNVWRANLRALLTQLTPLIAHRGESLWLAPSCSLLHVPIDLAQEQQLDPELRSWLAFAVQKLTELSVLRTALNQGEQAVNEALTACDHAHTQRARSPRVHRPAVAAALKALNAHSDHRNAHYPERARAQRAARPLPLLPTTTIGSFPQTTDIRAARAAYKQGKLSDSDYQNAMRAEIRHAIERQMALGLDVLVHGEAERNDMVEYFGEQLDGYAFSHHGWVQSYGSRCVKPPILYGDIQRPQAMTVAWTVYAQSLTPRPVKGMLTGPVTMLQWSFVRDDQPRADTCLQLALAIRQEVGDLEAAGIHVIQIDEPALREGLPLYRDAWPAYLTWATRAFRVAASGVANSTQIHTHMCYADFNDILPAIAALDADVLTLETSRSDMALLDAFAKFAYPNEIGPGVYDIHSPRIPRQEDMVRLLRKALSVIPAERLWVNPDCGLKTRTWNETEAALSVMLSAAQELRAACGHMQTV